MLSYNSIVYIAYTLVLIVIITCLTYMNAEACSGYDLVEKTEMQDERIGKIYMGVYNSGNGCIFYNLAASSFGCAGIP